MRSLPAQHSCATFGSVRCAARAGLGEISRSPVGVGIPPSVLGTRAARFDLAPARRLLAELEALERLSHQPPTARPRAPPSIRFQEPVS